MRVPATRACEPAPRRTLASIQNQKYVRMRTTSALLQLEMPLFDVITSDLMFSEFFLMFDVYATT